MKTRFKVAFTQEYEEMKTVELYALDNTEYDPSKVSDKNVVTGTMTINLDKNSSSFDFFKAGVVYDLEFTGS